MEIRRLVWLFRTRTQPFLTDEFRVNHGAGAHQRSQSSNGRIRNGLPPGPEMARK